MYVIRKDNIFYGKGGTSGDTPESVELFKELISANRLFNKIGGQIIDLEKRRIIKDDRFSKKNS